MTQIININLGGRNISIEDTAYQKVQEYLNSLRTHFKNEPGKDEIISDIENRFSELMSEKIRKGAAHITEADVEEMISVMGRPEDFDDAGTNTNEEGPGTYAFNTKRKLYRNASDKILGGVCSGVASWLNIDPAIVRVLFAIITLGGFGTGFLIYILLWIFLPVKNIKGYSGKRLFRNPENKIIGGVASGIGAYFGKDPSVIRWIFAIPFILSALRGITHWGWNDFDFYPNIIFGSLSGTFIAIYVILWIVLPEALSPYEKMEMRGQPVDLNTIRNNVQNSMGDVKERIQNWSKEVQDSAKKIGQQAPKYSRNIGRDFGTAAGRGARGLGHAIGVFFKVIFYIIFGSIIFSLFIALIAFLLSGYAFAPINNFLWTSDNQQTLAWGTLLLFIGAPIVGAVVWLVRKLFNVTTPGNYLNWLFGGLWTIGWVCLIFFIASVSKDFKRNQSVQTPVMITQPSGDKMILTVSQPELEYNGDFDWMRNHNDRINGFSITEDTLRMSDVAVNFEKSTDSFYHVFITRSSFGKTDAEATSRLSKIRYNIISKDSVLDLPSGFAVDKNIKYRLQNVTVIVQVPVGKKIQIDPFVKTKLNPMDIDIDNSNRGFRVYTRHRNIGYESNIVYTMDSTGTLTSPDEKYNDRIDDENYRWDNDEDAPVPPVAPAAPGTHTDADTVYHYYNTGPSDLKTEAEKNKQQILKELEQKQKEIEALKKKIGQ